MAQYRPGTLNDFKVNKRREKRTRRLADAANDPSGSSVYGLTEKIQSAGGDGASLEERLNRLESGGGVPIGVCVATTGSPPVAYGTWDPIGQQTMSANDGSSVTLTIYERKA